MLTPPTFAWLTCDVILHFCIVPSINMSSRLVDQLLNRMPLVRTTIGIYNILPSEIPHIDLFVRNEVRLHVIDPNQPLSLTYIVNHHITFVLVHTPDSVPHMVDQGSIRILYVDVSKLTPQDVNHIIARRLLFPKPDDSDINYTYTPLTAIHA